MDISNAKKCISDLKEQILIADTRCVSLKSQLDYMKMLYYDIRPETEEVKETKDILHDRIELLADSSAPISSISQASDTVGSTISEEADYHKSLERVSTIQYTSKQQDDTSKYSPCANSKLENLPNTTPRQFKEKLTEIINVSDNETKSTKSTPRIFAVSQSNPVPPLKMSPLSQEKSMSCKQYNEIQEQPCVNGLEAYPTESQHATLDLKESLEQLIAENRNEYLLQKLNSLKEDIKNHELTKNTARAKQNDASPRYKNPIKKEKKERAASSAFSTKKTSSCKMNDVISLKIRKRKGKLRCSSSKSTIATKDTSVLGKKELKRRKQRVFGTAITDRHISTSKAKHNTNEVVEIYHNTAANTGSNSVIFNKRSRLDRQANHICKSPTVVNEQRDVRVKSKYENNNYKHRIVDNKNGQPDNPRELPRATTKIEDANVHQQDQSNKIESARSPNFVGEKCNSRQCQHAVVQASYYDSMTAHNYEMPTLASKLKRTNRSYFNRFNFRNIPFVVGTSVTPSHNLGLNIQQVLSIMKTRQPTVNGITPLLIRKVSRGIKPVSVLMEQINDQCIKQSDMCSPTIDISTRNNFFLDHPTYSMNNSPDNESISLKQRKQNVENSKDTQSENQLNKQPQGGRAFLGNRGASDVRILKPFASHQNVKRRLEIPSVVTKAQQGTLDNGDSSDVRSIARTQSSKGIREVLVNLHDQFEEMNTKYEGLQAKLEKSGDKNLEEEISSLEKELNAKEDEINAVVSLYKEVMALKQQMKLLQERNSFVCISTEVSMNPNKAHSSLPLTLNKTYTMNPLEGYHRKKGNVTGMKEPSASIRLAGLLRQIQTFQKQLNLAS